MKYPAAFLQTTISLFLVLGILFIPFSFYLLDIQLPVTDFFFGELIYFVSTHIFNCRLADTKVYSDSGSMYVLLLLLLVFSALITIILIKMKRWQRHSRSFLDVAYRMGIYYLALILLKYGADKIFKTQFYLPEPNILFTPVGQVDKDLFYWTSMGTSRSYNLFAGIVEMMAAVMVLFSRTRLAGLLVAVAALLQIVAINFSFDISVKLYSLFLLLLSLYLLSPWYRRLFTFLFASSNIAAMPPGIRRSGRLTFIFVFSKTLLTGLIFLETFYPYFKTGNFNDDTAERPYLHGAYDVQQVIYGLDTLEKCDYPIRRFFIHRGGYLIFQDSRDQMKDFALTYDTLHHLLLLEDYQQKQVTLPYKYNTADSMLTLLYMDAGREYIITGKGFNWKNLPLLRRNFHWTMDN